MEDGVRTAKMDQSDGGHGNGPKAALGLTDWAAVLIPPLVILVMPVAQVLGANFSYFWDDLLNSVKYFAFAAVAYLLFGFLFFARYRQGKAWFLYGMYLLTALAWVVLRVAKMIFPTGVASLLVAAGVIAVIVFLIRRQSIGKLQNAVVVLGTIVIFGFSFEMMQYDFSRSQSASVRETPAGPPREDLPNVYHILMDEFQIELFNVNLDDRVRNALSGFTYYPEARTTFGRTDLALASIVSGREYQFDIPLKDYFLKSYGERTISRALRGHGYRTSGRILKGYLRYGLDKQFDETYVQNWTTLASIITDGPGLLASLWMKRELPDILAEIVMAPEHYGQLKSSHLTSDLAPVRSLISFRNFLAEEGSKAGHGRYEFHHLMVPHHPLVLDAQCGYEFGRRTTPAVQTGCAVLLIEEFVATLKKLGRYKDSVILIHADHGLWMTFRDGKLVLDDSGTKSTSWNWGRSRPLVLFKPAGAGMDGDQLAVSSRPVVLRDLMPTILDAVGLPEPDGLTGRSILATDFPDRPVRYYHMYDKEYGKLSIASEDIQRYIIAGTDFFLDEDFVLPSIE